MDKRPGPTDAPPPKAPVWVKALAALAAGLVLLVIGLHLTGRVPSHHFAPSGHAADVSTGPAEPR